MDGDTDFDFPIIRNAPPPPAHETRGRKKADGPVKHRPRKRYPWPLMKVGDAFDIPLSFNDFDTAGRHPAYNAAAATISKRNRDGCGRYVIRMLDDYRARVWRVG